MTTLDTFRISLIILMTITGAMNTLSTPTPNQDDKYQNKQKVNQGGIDKYFYHPYMQTTAVFIGQSIALPLYYLLKKRDPESFEKRRREAIDAVGVSAICDVFGSTMQCIALNFISGSAYQMMRGGTVATTFLFTILYLKQKAKKNQIFGSLLTIAGVLLVGGVNLIYSATNPNNQSTGLQITGYLLLIFSLFLNGFQFTYQQSIFQKYHIQPIQMVGIQGLIGLSINLIMIISFTFIPCGFGIDACVYSNDGGAYLQRPIFSIIGCYVLTVMVFNVTGLSITRYINALARAICDVSRTVIVWLVGIIVTVTIGKEEDNYVWERVEGGAIGLQVVGFGMIVVGNMVYNRIIVVGCMDQGEERNRLLDGEQGEG